MTEHAVIVHLKLSDTDASADEVEQLQILSDRLSEAITDQNAGEFDGDEFGGGECVLYMYGPDADALFGAIEPVLRASPLTKGGYAIKRYGVADDEDAREVQVKL